jgi:hypothetical protein
MQERELTIILLAAKQAGVLDAALPDAMNRGRQAFAETPVDATEARAWAEGLRWEAPHFFEQAAPGPVSPAAPDAPVGLTRSRRPQSRILTPAELKTLEGPPLTERLTRGREMQQRPLGTTSS